MMIKISNEHEQPSTSSGPQETLLSSLKDYTNLAFSTKYMKINLFEKMNITRILFA